jgi:hypothetical protein
MTRYHIQGAAPNPVPIGQPFSVGAGADLVRYPGNWLSMASMEDRAAIGAVAEPVINAETQALDHHHAMGWSVRDKTAEELDAELGAAQESALVQIDRRAGNARQAIASTGAFLSAEYERAAAQAESCLAGGAGPFKALEADVAAGTVDPRTGQPVETELQSAEVVMLTKGVWDAALDDIRAKRLKAKADVRSAATPAAVRSVLAGLPWPE